MKIRIPHSAACVSAALLALAGPIHAADLEQEGQITINPPTSPVILSLQGPAFDNSTDPRGLTLSYHDDSSTGVFRLYRSTGQYEWQFSTGIGNGYRSAMTLANDHSLTLFDPANPATKLVLSPGGISIGGFPVLNSSQANQAYLPLHPLSFASGTGASATGLSSTALGIGTVANGDGQVVVGRWNRLQGWAYQPAPSDWLFAVGNGTSDSDRSTVFFINQDGRTFLRGSLAVGDDVWADKFGNLAVGTACHAIGEYTVALGRVNYATGDYSAGIGVANTTSGFASIGLAAGGVSSGVTAFSVGYACTATNDFAFAQGQASIAAGQGSVALGSSVAIGSYAQALGLGAKAIGYGQVVVGRFNIVQGNQYGDPWHLPDGAENLFVVGNGNTEQARSNAFEVKNNGDVNVKGVLRMQPAGDLGMGVFFVGPTP